MIDELYHYAYPKLTEEQKKLSNTVYLIFGTVFISGILTLLIKEFFFCIAHIVLYLMLSLLGIFDKDYISRHLKMSTISILSLLVTILRVISYTFSEYKLPLWIIGIGILFFVIYDVVILTRIKNKRYFSANNKATTSTVSTSTILFAIIIFRIFNRIPGGDFLVITSIVIIGAIIEWFTIMLFQKYIVVNL